MLTQHIVLELLHSAENPRNSEGSFVTLKDGRILFSYTHFYKTWLDDGPAFIAARYSEDQGQTWSSTDRILVENEGKLNVMCPSLLRLQDGRIALFYMRKNGLHDCRLRMRISTDEAESWSEPVLCIPAPGYFITNNDRVIQLSSGRLVVPASYHRRFLELKHATESICKDKIRDHHGIALFFLSDDLGATWREAKTWWSLPVPSGTGLQEPGVVELSDGTLYAFCRTDVGCQYAMCSTDNGETWTPPEPTCFRSPRSPLSIKRIPSSGDLLAVWNDRSDRWGLPKPEPSSVNRTPLVVAISDNNGRTWNRAKLLEGDPANAYAYTAIHFVKDAVFLVYSYGRKNCPCGVRMRRLDLDWLLS